MSWLKHPAFSVLALVALYIISIPNRFTYIDDPWLGEQAYWLSKLGYVKSNLWWGMNGYENIHLAYHKFFIICGALYISLFGWGVQVLKSVSFTYFLLFLFVFWYYLKSLKLFSKTQQVWALAFFASLNLVFFYSFVFRPELTVMVIGFSGFYFFRQFLVSEKTNQKIYQMIVAGFFMGLAGATHLQGLSFVGAAGLYLLFFKRDIRLIAAFAVSSLAGFGVYFWDVNSIERFNAWTTQFLHDPALSEMPRTFWSRVLKPLEEHKRFFHQEHEIAFSLLFFIPLIYFFKDLKTRFRIELWFLLLLVFTLGLISMNQTDKSLLLSYPFMVAISMYVVFKYPTWWVRTLLVLCVGINIVINIREISEAFDVTGRSSIAAKYIDKKNAKVLADIGFIFNQIEHHTIISSSDYTQLAMRYQRVKPSVEGYLKFIEDHGIEYICLDSRMGEKEVKDLLAPYDLTLGNKWGPFEVTYNHDGIIVMRRNQINGLEY